MYLYVLSERSRLYFSFISLIHTRFCPLSFFHALAFTLSFAHTCSRSCSYCDMQTFSYCMTFCTSAHTTTMACAFMKSQRAAKTDFGTERTHAYATQFASRYRSFASSFVLTHIHTHMQPLVRITTKLKCPHNRNACVSTRNKHSRKFLRHRSFSSHNEWSFSSLLTILSLNRSLSIALSPSLTLEYEINMNFQPHYHHIEWNEHWFLLPSPPNKLFERKMLRNWQFLCKLKAISCM